MGIENKNSVDTTVNGQIVMRLVQNPIRTFIPYIRMANGVHFQVAKAFRTASEAKKAGYEAVASRIGGKKISHKVLKWEIDNSCFSPKLIKVNTGIINNETDHD